MNYRHAFHAGNFADVLKHLALVSILAHLKKKPAPFAVVDTHAGRGLYDLVGEEAQRSGEAAAGIGRLLDVIEGPETLRTYLDLVRALGRDRYPGSPLIAARLLRPQDRLVAIEKHPEDAAALESVLAPYGRARIAQADGYARLPSLLPPPERRGLILIDPPYEASDEFSQAARVVADGYRRFATGIFMIWFPIKSAAAAHAFCGEVRIIGPRKLLRVDVAVDGDPDRLNAAGLLIINPPYGFADDMKEVLKLLAPLLGRVRDAKLRVDWLAGEE
jgi:23S rRNA (adenine2030-N6)-methyltransferase